MSKDKQSFAAHLYKAQGGKCYLGITQECLACDRAMHADQLRKGECSPRGWTWEHVIPRWVSRNLHSGVNLRLLACNACNGAKGNALPTPEQIEFALELHEAFGQHGDARGLIVRFRAWHEGGASIESTSPQPCDDADVPNTVEEALAQGGIYVSAPSPSLSKPQKTPRELQRKDAHQEAMRLRQKADKAEIVGDMANARVLRAQAWALIDEDRRVRRDEAAKAA